MSAIATRRPARLNGNEVRDIEAFVDERLAEVSEAVIANQNARHNDLKEQVEELRTLFLSAFPGGDPGMHRYAHELLIEAAKADKELKQDLIKKLSQSGIWAVISGIGFVIFWWIKDFVRGGSK